MISGAAVLSILLGHVIGSELTGLALGWAGLHGGASAILAVFGTKAMSELSTAFGVVSGGSAVGKLIHGLLHRDRHPTNGPVNVNVQPAPAVPAAGPPPPSSH